jgi:N utilization substance protein B
MIADAAKNWDVERIAFIDQILMKMALAELIYFPEVPIRVTLNEVIEISKNYSTPKSSKFINGILDKLSIKLQADKTIVKVGRGLL